MSQEVKILLGIGIVSLILIVAAAFFMGGTGAPGSTATEKADPKILVRPTSHKSTATLAKVTIVEFGDYQCPACGAAHPIVKQVLETYGNKVTLVFRNYPLVSVHKNAFVAAQAAEAAAAQGKFWEMHNQLYDKQTEWSDVENPISLFVGYAKKLGLDEKKFEQEVKDSSYTATIQNDQKDGDTVSVNATPTFFINGEKQQGLLTLEQFKSKINPLLK